MYILCKIYLNRYKGVKCGISTQYVLTHASISTVTTLSVPCMCRKNVMSMTYVLERQRNTDCCPVLSVGAHGALLWQSALNMSLGMLHYLHCAFLWPRWDMTGATGSSWIKQRSLKAQGEGRGWQGGLGRQQSTGAADCNAHVAAACGAGRRWGGEEGRDTPGQRERGSGQSTGERFSWRRSRKKRLMQK